MEQDIEPKHPGGRPTKRTPEITDQICEAISYGLTDEEVAALAGIDDSTLTRWKKDPEFCGAIKRAVAMRKLDRLKRIESGALGWQGTAWAMERLYPKEFGRPEVLLQYKVAEDAKETGDFAQILDWAQR
jgi:AraC-like DNA-binding protein